jgi:hypothetical protein
MALTVKSLRKPATHAARGTVLAVHAAASLADSVDRDAARLLRAAEGMARAAVALLETTVKRSPGVGLREPTRGAEGPEAGACHNPGTENSAPAGGTGGAGSLPAAQLEKRETKKRRKRNRKKKTKGEKGKTVDSKETHNEKKRDKGKEKTATTPVVSVPVSEMELDDAWADKAVGAQAPTLQASATSPPAPDATAATPTVLPGVTVEVIALGAEDSILKPGLTVTVVNYPDDVSLNGSIAKINSECTYGLFKQHSGWTCTLQVPAAGSSLKTGDCVTLPPECLKPVLELTEPPKRSSAYDPYRGQGEGATR